MLKLLQPLKNIMGFMHIVVTSVLVLVVLHRCASSLQSQNCKHEVNRQVSLTDACIYYWRLILVCIYIYLIVWINSQYGEILHCRSLFPEPKARENTAHECNVSPY